jgi:hypothetical protein
MQTQERFYAEVRRGTYTLRTVASAAEEFGRPLTQDNVQLLECGDGRERPLLEIPRGVARALQSRPGSAREVALWYRNAPTKGVWPLSRRHFKGGAPRKPTVGGMEKRGTVIRASRLPPQHV